MKQKPSERIEQIRQSRRTDGPKRAEMMTANMGAVLKVAMAVGAVIEYLDEQAVVADLSERKRIQRAMPETFGSMGRDARATQKLRRLHDELRSWKLDYEQRISKLDPAENTRDFEITYKAFVVGIERLMEIIEQ